MVEKVDAPVVEDVASFSAKNARSDDTLVYAGGCLCGAIRYTARRLRPLWYCHCQQCRKMTGHFMAAAQVDLADISILGKPKWFYVSAASRHGFCGHCGCQLFWRNDSNDYLSLTGGGLDDSQGLEVAGHVFTAEKGAYYEIADGELRYSLGWDKKRQ